MSAEFHNAACQRASVESEIINPASVGEEIALYPFNVSFEVSEGGIEGTWNAFENAFSNDSDYDVERISEKVFRVARRDESVIDDPLTCSYIATAVFSANFKGKFQNGAVGEVTLIDSESQLAPESGIGLWIQRDFKSYKYPTNEKLIEDFKNKVENKDVETAEIVISYNLVEPQENYSEDYNQEDYS